VADARTADLAEEVATNSASAIRPYIESMTESLRQAGGRPVLRWEGASTTGSELLAAIYRYARALESLGIARGDLVAMYAPNRPEALALRYATHLLGAASAYLSAPPDPGKRAQMLVDFRPRLVVVFPETAHLLPPTTAPCGAIGPVEEIPLHLDELASGQDTAPMASRARPGNAPPAGQRQARLPDPGPRRHHAARRRHGHPAEHIPACFHPRRDRD
jgi:fatty-acyl-CoA synthase